MSTYYGVYDFKELEEELLMDLSKYKKLLRGSRDDRKCFDGSQ